MLSSIVFPLAERDGPIAHSFDPCTSTFAARIRPARRLGLVIQS